MREQRTTTYFLCYVTCFDLDASKYYSELCIHYLRAQGRCGELRDDGGQQTTGVGDQVWREQLHLLPQTLSHWQHYNHQHLLQYLSEAGHSHQVLLRLSK